MLVSWALFHVVGHIEVVEGLVLVWRCVNVLRWSVLVPNFVIATHFNYGGAVGGRWKEESGRGLCWCWCHIVVVVYIA